MSKLAGFLMAGALKALECQGACSYCLGGGKIIGSTGVVTCPECKGTREAQPGQCTYKTPPSQRTKPRSCGSCTSTKPDPD